MKDKWKTILMIAIGVIILILIITIVVLLVTKKKPTTTTTTQKGTLVYWGLWEPVSVMQPLIDEFESANPGVDVQYSQQTFGGYENRIYTRLQQTTTSSEPAPDIFRIHNTWLPKYYSYLSTVPSSIMTSEEYATKFYPTALSDFTGKDGKLYAIPIEIDGLVVFYNKQLLAAQGVTAPPKDWDSFFELARKLTKKDASKRITTAGLAIGTARNVRHASEIISFLLLQEGATIIDETKTRVNLNNTKVAGVFETYTNFAEGENAIWSSTLRTDLEMFFNGTLAMMIAPSWRAFDIIEAAPSIEFDTAPLPQLKANKTEIYYSSYWGEAVNKTSTNTELAWKFIKFLSDKEQQMKMYSNSSKIRAFGEPYSLVELNEEMREKTYVSAIAEMAPYMKSWQIGDESFVKATLNEAITKISENGLDVEVALKEAETIINNKLAQTNK